MSKIWTGTGDGVKELVKVGDKVNYAGYADSSGYANSAGNIPDVTPYNNHINNRSNPHNVTCAQIGAAAANHSHPNSGFNTIVRDATHNQHGGTLTIDFGVQFKLAILCEMQKTVEGAAIVSPVICTPEGTIPCYFSTHNGDTENLLVKLNGSVIEIGRAGFGSMFRIIAIY